MNMQVLKVTAAVLGAAASVATAVWSVSRAAGVYHTEQLLNAKLDKEAK